ncbi:transposase [Rhizobium mongolense]|uniref:transposase n=1 Tax=Rhizobium mongolense TaxID=57676 RepID=UPI0009FE3DED
MGQPSRALCRETTLLVAATFEPEARVSEIARSAGIHVSQLFRWRFRALRSGRLDGLRGILLLFGIGTLALPPWDRKNEAFQSRRRPQRN